MLQENSKKKLAFKMENKNKMCIVAENRKLQYNKKYDRHLGKNSFDGIIQKSCLQNDES